MSYQTYSYIQAPAVAWDLSEFMYAKSFLCEFVLARDAYLLEFQSILDVIAVIPSTNHR